MRLFRRTKESSPPAPQMKWRKLYDDFAIIELYVPRGDTEEIIEELVALYPLQESLIRATVAKVLADIP